MLKASGQKEIMVQEMETEDRREGQASDQIDQTDLIGKEDEATDKTGQEEEDFSININIPPPNFTSGGGFIFT